MDPQMEGGCRSRRKFLGRFAIPVQSRNALKEERSPPTRPALSETVQNDTFGDSFCNLGVLDDVCEIEARYTVTCSSRKSHKEVPCPQKTLEILQPKSDEISENVLHSNKTSSYNATEFCSNNKHPGTFNRTKSQDLRRSPRFKTSSSGNIKNENYDVASKEFDESNNSEKQKKIMLEPVEMNTLETINAMDLSDSDFPDEITSPGDEMQKEAVLGYSLLRNSRINNFINASKLGFSNSSNENVRRSQRLRIKKDTCRTDSVHLPNRSKKNFNNVNGTDKVKHKLLYSNCRKGTEGRNSCVRGEDDFPSNIDFHEAGVLKEIHTNSSLGISTSVDKFSSKFNSKLKNNVCLNKENCVNEKGQHSVDPCIKKDIPVTKDPSDAKMTFLTATKVLNEQTKHLEVQGLMKKKKINL